MTDEILRYRCTGCNLDEGRDWQNRKHYTGTTALHPLCTGRMFVVRYVPEDEAELDTVRDLVLGLAQACNETGNPVVPTPVAEAISALTSWAREERTA